MTLDPAQFSDTLEGKQASLHLLTNGRLQVGITSYGARIASIVLDGSDGTPADVVVGFDSLQGYLHSKETYYGAIVGRYANRVAKGRFSLDGKAYELAVNNPPNHLHGGPGGFHVQVWDVEAVSGNTVKLSYFSKDGEEGYPGNLTVSLVYTLGDDGSLAIDYEAATDAATIINLTSHPFFNLNGQGSGTIADHVLQIHAGGYNPVDAALIPRGVESVAGTPFDFREPKKIGAHIDDDDEQLRYGAGYDHNYVLSGSGFRTVAKATGDRTGITMEVLTDQPAMQLYSGNYMKSENRIKGGHTDRFREAFCLETQHYPDSPNQPAFPSTVLRPGEVFRSRTVYRFTAGD